MHFQLSGIGSALLVLVASATAAQPQPPTPFEILNNFGQTLYVTGEKTGGSPEEWSKAEIKALIALQKALEADSSALRSQDAKGRSPLTIAAAKGYVFMVAAMLQHPEVVAAVDHKDGQGYRALDHALLSASSNLQACHPEIENLFVLVPFLVALPYYTERTPYPQIVDVLIKAGANPDTSDARALWLEKCSNDVAEDREAVRTNPDLLTTLAQIQDKVGIRKRQKDLEETAMLYREIFAPRVKSGKMTQEEIEEAIAELYRKEGLSPPASKPEQGQ